MKFDFDQSLIVKFVFNCIRFFLQLILKLIPKIYFNYIKFVIRI
jgi:hypothetical protein